MKEKKTLIEDPTFIKLLTIITIANVIVLMVLMIKTFLRVINS